MRHNRRRIAPVLFLSVALLSACSRGPAAPAKIEPATVEEIEGSDFRRVTVTEKAAQRLDLQTTMVREEHVVRSQTVVAEVVANRRGPPIRSNLVWLRVPSSAADLQMVARDQPAVLRSLEDDEAEDDFDGGETGRLAELDEAPDVDDADEAPDVDDAEEALYYVAEAGKSPLKPGQRVFLTLPLRASEAALKIVPYEALIYDTQGGTFVYVREPGTLSFVRHPVTVVFIEGGLVYLLEGPAEGTEVVTRGVAELYGAETGVSK